MARVKSIFLFCICLFTIHNSSSEAVNDPLQYFLADLKSLKVKFVQTLMNENGGELEKTEGILYLEPPKKFFWHYKQPYSQKIISDGNILWIFDEDLEQVTIKKIDNKISQTPAGIILGNNSIKQHFVEINMGFIDGYEWIELTPKDLEAQYKSIKMGFDNDKLGMMIIIDNLEQISRIDFSDLKKNISLPLNIFNFEVPDNIDIFDETK